jgi:hypothetical protein
MIADHTSKATATIMRLYKGWGCRLDGDDAGIIPRAIAHEVQTAIDAANDTRLDRLALAAMTALIIQDAAYGTATHSPSGQSETGKESDVRLAKAAYDIAEAMIREREKRLRKP